MNRQDAIDKFTELNNNGNTPLLVRMKIRSLLYSCESSERKQELENYSQIVNNLNEFTALINDPEIVKISSIVIPTKKTKPRI